MKILLTGSNGTLGKAFRALSKEPKYKDIEWVFTTRQDMDVTNLEQCKTVIDAQKPDVLINLAAWNAVDRAETESEGAFMLNRSVPADLTGLCVDRRIRMVHYSTNYVFGEGGFQIRGWSELQQPNPMNVYGQSKLEGEWYVLSSPYNIVIRTSWLYGGPDCNDWVHNLVGKLLSQGWAEVPNDQLACPTYAPDLARWTMGLIQRRFTGLIHACGSEIVRKSDWAQDIAAVMSMLLEGDFRIRPVQTRQDLCPRPLHCGMDNSLLQSVLGEDIRNCDFTLHRALTGSPIRWLPATVGGSEGEPGCVTLLEKKESWGSPGELLSTGFETWRRDNSNYWWHPEMLYCSRVMAQKAKGPHQHKEQSEFLIFPGPGEFIVYLIKEGATVGRFFRCGNSKPAIVWVPAGTVHAYKNISDPDKSNYRMDGLVLCLPDRLYKGWNKQEEEDVVKWESRVDSPYILPQLWGM